MVAILEAESTLTERYQTTVPESVRRALRLGSVAAAAGEAAASPEKPSEPAKRWYEIVSEQDTERFASLTSIEQESAVQAQ